jgi:hypothetical protein
MGTRTCQDRCKYFKIKIHPKLAYNENKYCKMCSCFIPNKNLVKISGLRCPCCNNKVRMERAKRSRRVGVKRISA